MIYRIAAMLALLALTACAAAPTAIPDRSGGRDEPRHPPGCASACASPDGPSTSSGKGGV